MKKITTIKTQWDLKNLTYKSLKDPKIESDIKKIEAKYSEFAKKYSNKKFLNSSKSLRQALDDYESLQSLINPSVYLKLASDLDAKNKDIPALRNKVSERLTQSSNKILFFNLSLGQISKKDQAKLLKDPILKKYRYFLKQIFDASKYQLSEPEEKIIRSTLLPARDLWIQNRQKLESNQSIKFKGKEISFGKATSLFRSLNKKDRATLAKLVNEKFKEISYFSECELNAIILHKKILNDMRGYKKPYSQTIIGYQNDEGVVENLVKVVTSGFKISHRFYKIKARLLKEKTLGHWDRSAKIGDQNKKIPFEKGLSIIETAFAKANPKYSEILKRYIINGQIDVFPRLGKASGAYCWTNTNMPTFVLLNYTDDVDSVMTFAHEMGHAIHGELSKNQPLIYEGHTISVAEVASTLFENFAFDEIFKTLSQKEKIIALHDRIQDDIQTIFRQIAFFNFETELHNQIREKGALSAKEIAQLMNKHVGAYLGPVFKMTEDDGYFFVYLSHIRRFFYVYSYAYGQIISKALYKKYTEDNKFIHKIEQFLSSGESMSPEDIFKSIGIDTQKPDFFKEGLQQIEKDIETLEKLINK